MKKITILEDSTEYPVGEGKMGIDYTKRWINDHYNDAYCSQCISRLALKKKFFHDSGIKCETLYECYECGETKEVAPLYKFLGEEYVD